jgi:hypothetical protein
VPTKDSDGGPFRCGTFQFLPPTADWLFLSPFNLRFVHSRRDNHCRSIVRAQWRNTTSSFSPATLARLLAPLPHPCIMMLLFHFTDSLRSQRRHGLLGLARGWPHLTLIARSRRRGMIASARCRGPCPPRLLPSPLPPHASPVDSARPRGRGGGRDRRTARSRHPGPPCGSPRIVSLWTGQAGAGGRPGQPTLSTPSDQGLCLRRAQSLPPCADPVPPHVGTSVDGVGQLPTWHAEAAVFWRHAGRK